MDVKRNDVKKIVKEKFINNMYQYGFQQIKRSSDCFRVRGEFFDVMGVQIGRNAGSLYLHYFMNLIADPVANSLATYRVGERLHRHPKTNLLWYGETEKEVTLIVESITDVATTVALPFFDGVKDYKDYTIEILGDVNKRAFDFDLTVSLARLHKYNKVYWLCDEGINKLNSNDDYDEKERKNLYGYMKSLQNAAQSNSKEQVDNLLDSWKEKKLESLCLL